MLIKRCEVEWSEVKVFFLLFFFVSANMSEYRISTCDGVGKTGESKRVEWSECVYKGGEEGEIKGVLKIIKFEKATLDNTTHIYTHIFMKKCLWSRRFFQDWDWKHRWKYKRRV